MSSAPKTTIKRARAEIQEIMEVWARYSQGRIDGGIGYPKKVPLGKLQDGIPTNKCPICIGREKPYQNCPVCGGDGRVKLEANDSKANPAFITGNGPRIHYDDDPRSQRVDWLICTALTEDQRIVVISTYRSNGTQDHKARKMGISREYFSRLLGKAHDIILSRLYDVC
jgi:hypothetical protein